MTSSTKTNDILLSISALLKNPHLWILFAMTSFLVLIYQFWPWRDFQFPGIWHWFTWLSALGKLAIFESLSSLIGSLFIVPCIYASLVFRLGGSVVVSLISLAALLPLMLSMWHTPESWVTNIMYLFAPVILTTIVNVELRLRSRDKQHYIELEKERQLHLSRVIEAQEKARQRIAREIHDESIQTLLATASHTERLKFIDNIDEIKTKATWIEKNIRSTVVELRRISLDLRPTILDDLGLIPALRWLIDQPDFKENLKIQVLASSDEIKISPEVELAVFRVVQEALNNIKNHAKADNATISIKLTSSLLIVSVRDNGQGFRVPRRLTSLAVQGKLGLIDIQERIQLLGGRLSVKSKPNGGTLLLMEIPVNGPA